MILKAGMKYGTWTSGGNPVFISDNDGNGMVGQDTVSYTSTDNSSVISGRTITNNKLHVNGSIQLTGNNDAIVFGRGTSSFLADEELAFGWGGGLYMTEATTMYIRNNKSLYTSGNVYGARFYDANNDSYYADPAATSVFLKLHLNSTSSLLDGTDPDLSTQTIYATSKVVTPRLVFLNDAAGDDNYIEHTDTNTAETIAGSNDFGATYYFVGDKRVATTSNSAAIVASGILSHFGQFNNQVRSPVYYDNDNPAYYGDFGSTP